MFVDSHCHLNYKGLVEEQGTVLARARGAGVSKMLNISTRASEWDDVIAVAERERNVDVRGLVQNLGRHRRERNRAEVA